MRRGDFLKILLGGAAGVAVGSKAIAVISKPYRKVTFAEHYANMPYRPCGDGIFEFVRNAPVRRYIPSEHPMITISPPTPVQFQTGQAGKDLFAKLVKKQHEKSI